jgi:ABC-2 type transport system ATP-binding protein
LKKSKNFLLPTLEEWDLVCFNNIKKKVIPLENAISTTNLVKKYRGKGKEKKLSVNALVDLNLKVKIGDIYGFIGPNGAGKTTTLKILMGLISPTSGSALVMGHESGSVESKKKVGYLSEVSYYYPFIEVRKLLDFYCSFYEIPHRERKKKIAEVLEMVNLSDKASSRMSELSKGMQQKFGIAQAIIADPPLLILDELTSGLDPIAQKEVKDIVINLKERGKTIFFSSHQMTEVEMICDQIGIIHKGRMLKSAELDDFIKEGTGNRTKIIVKTNAPEFINLMKDKNIEVTAEKAGISSFNIPENEVNTILDILRDKKMEIIEVSPCRHSLEDAFFKLIKEAK